MKNLLLVLVAALVILTLGGAGWVLLAQSDEAAMSRATAETVDANSETATQLKGADADSEVNTNDVDTGALSNEAEARTNLGSEDSGEQISIRGRVKAPFSAPEDPNLEAFALSYSPEYDEFRQMLIESTDGQLDSIILDRVDVGKDGTFELKFPQEFERGWVMLAGRYLYSMEGQEVQLPSDTELVHCATRWVLSSGRVDSQRSGTCHSLTRRNPGRHRCRSVRHGRNAGQPGDNHGELNK